MKVFADTTNNPTVRQTLRPSLAAVFLVVALVFLMLRFAPSQMDVPTRTSYVMAVATPAEGAAAARFTAVPRRLTAAVSPMLAG
jgi:hypothetical protein